MAVSAWLGGMPSAPLPEPLTSRAFRYNEAKELGESSGGLRRRGLHRVTHGVHMLTEPEEVRDRLAALLVGLPAGVAYSHHTARRLHGMPDVSGPRGAGTEHVIRATDTGPIRRSGVIGHRGLESRHLVERQGLPVIDAADTWCDFGELIRRDRLSLADLVVLGDAAANVILRPDRTAYDFSDHRPPWVVDTSLDERLAARELRRREAAAVLAERLERRVRPRGKALLSAALPLIRPGVRSPMESRARLVFDDAGFPAPHVNLDIYSGEGRWLAEGDLVWVEARVVAEYQGAHHADRVQASHDSRRRQLLGDHGWRTREIWAEDLVQWERRLAMLRRFGVLLGHPFP